MKILKLIIKQTYFDQILAGIKTQELREIKPTISKKLVHYLHGGIVYETVDEIPPEGDIEVVPMKYDSIRFYVGYNTDRDSAAYSGDTDPFEPFVIRLLSKNTPKGGQDSGMRGQDDPEFAHRASTRNFTNW